MNVLFHVAAAVGITAILIKPNEKENRIGSAQTVQNGALTFTLGAIFHGALDYIPHCYPINAKVDAITGLLLILIFVFLTKKQYQLPVALAFLGSLFPDLLDLARYHQFLIENGIAGF